jgi:hypothetical protein
MDVTGARGLPQAGFRAPEQGKFQVQGSRLKGNGKGNGANRKGREELKESPSPFFKDPAFAVLCVLGVLCG